MMEFDFLSVIGLPLRDERVVKMLKDTSTEQPEKGHHAPTSYNIDMGFMYSFRSRYVFERSYLVPPFLTEDMPFPRVPFDDPDAEVCEPMLEEIGINSNYKGVLPFGLKFGKDISNFIAEGKHYKKIKYSEGYGCCFLRGDYELELQFTADNEFHRLRIMPVGNDTRKYLRLKELLREQNKNINPESAQTLPSMKNSKPTLTWQKRMIAGDDCFSEESINATDIILDSFVDQLIVASLEKKASKVLSAVKKAVERLNKLNNKHNHIETMEREELCDFISSVVASTGYVLNDEDVTYEWREW
ncbi:hypothetical protein LJB84_02405 [Bacteroidales bacterium OttesenSCG-928-J19]|nr:hypothetical protein [Bacteroidales bacterium OttesenSCG-928-J19]